MVQNWVSNLSDVLDGEKGQNSEEVGGVLLHNAIEQRGYEEKKKAQKKENFYWMV